MEINHVLIVEDDKEIREGVQIYLQSQGYKVFQAADGIEGLEVLEREEIHLAIIDIMMPRMDGIRMTMKLREKYDFPVIMLSAKSEEVDKITGLNIGADDYVTKPFSPSILKRKIAVILKRTGQNEKRDQGQYDDGYLRIDFDKMTAQRGTETLLLTPNEYRILKLFVENAGRILTRQVLLERLYDCDENFIDEHTLTVNMTRLRKKIEDTSHKYIQTIYGMGYLFARGEGHEA